MYFEDLSFYASYGQEIDKNIYRIGWLENGHEYVKGDVTDVFVEKLWGYTHFAVAMKRGFHVCDVCESSQREIPVIEYRSKKLKVGYAEIRVFGETGKIYAAPNLLFHYITEHSYKPPNEFIQAVLHTCEPSSSEYSCYY